jgi:hypothetical protein
LESPALVADGDHARIDAYVSLAVIASALAIAAGAPILDPLIGLGMTVVILRITRESRGRYAGIRTATRAGDRHGSAAPRGGVVIDDALISQRLLGSSVG